MTGGLFFFFRSPPFAEHLPPTFVSGPPVDRQRLHHIHPPPPNPPTGDLKHYQRGQGDDITVRVISKRNQTGPILKDATGPLIISPWKFFKRARLHARDGKQVLPLKMASPPLACLKYHLKPLSQARYGSEWYASVFSLAA